MSCPSVVAMAADASGPIYEGAAGPRDGRRERPGDPGHDVPHRLDDEDGRDRRRAAAGRARQPRPRRAGRAVPARSSPTCRCSRASTATRRACARRRRKRDRAPARHATRAGSRTGSGTPTSCAGEECTGTPNVLSGSTAIFTAPLVADPGTRYEYGINTDWLGRVVEAASGQSLDAYFAEHILGPLGMTSTTFLMSARAARQLGADPPARRGAARGSRQRRRLGAGAGVVGRRPRAVLDAARLPDASSACCWAAGRSTAPRSSTRATVDGSVHQPDRRARLPARDPDRGPGHDSADFNAGPGYKFGLGLLLNTERASPAARKAGSGAWAGLFNTHFWVDRASGVTGAIYSQTLPFVEPRGVPGLRRLRARAVRLARARARSGAAASSASPRRRARRRA